MPQYNGSAQYQATYEGSVNAQGVLVMHVGISRLEAQIDGRGTVTGRIIGADRCTYLMVWQKEGK